MPGTPSLVLASASPRRRDLLLQIGCIPDRIVTPDIDESTAPGEMPRDHALRLARAKAESAAAGNEGHGAFVLGADTVVAAGRRILPKAEDEASARACLALLSGRRHKVFGAVALVTPGGATRTRIAATTVSFKRLTEAERERYIATGEWRGKAGGYAIQGQAAVFVRFIGGSYSNVVGLPLYETRLLLEGAGFGDAWGRAL